MAERTAWDRTPDETAPAWQAFQMYRDMGIQRSQQAVSKQLGKSRALMSRWAVRHRWVDRAAAYEHHLDLERQAEAEQAVRDMARRHAQIATAGLNVVIQRLIGQEGIPGSDQAHIDKLDPESLSAQDVARFAVAFAQLEREARGYVPMSDHIDTDLLVEPDGVDMTDGDDQDKVIEFAEWLSTKSA